MTVAKQTMFFTGVAGFAALGALVGGWLLRGQYPVSEKTRVLLTTTVRPGQPVEIAREVDRRDNCEINVRGYIEYANGKREPLKQTFDPGFGPLGYDGYVMEIPTSPSAAFGPAYIWSKPGSACNPLQDLLNLWTPGQEKIDKFIVGPEEVRVPVPKDLKIRRPAQAQFESLPNRAGTDESNRHVDPDPENTAFPPAMGPPFIP
jgi:hypothetical protein